MADKRTRLSDISRAGKKAEKPTVIGAIRDPQFVRDVMQGLGETATRGITGVLGAPVDITTMAMRPFGYSVPAEQVVGGSEYLGKQMERAGMLSGNRNQLSELLAGLVTPDPLDVAKLGAMAVPAVGRMTKAEDMLDLYHGSYKPIENIEDKGLFGGVFASASREAAASHGDMLHKINLNKDDLLTQYALDYDIDYEKVSNALKKQLRDEDDFDLVYKTVVEDAPLHNMDIDEDTLLRTFGTSDLGEAAWEAQKMRGQLAKNLGYKAVEMQDEHGLSYLVLPGQKINREMAAPVAEQVARQAPRDEALRIAQANAAKPVSEGGLGLPPDNTPMQRAKAMGFDFNLFHGSDKDIQELKKYSTRGGLGSLYVSDEPKTPNEYAMLGAQLRDLLPEHLKNDVEYLKDFYDDDLLEYAMKTQKVAPQRSPNVLPLMARSQNAMSASDDFSDYGKYINTEYPEAIKQNWEDAFPVLGNDAYLLQNADPHLIGMQVTGDISDYTAAKRVPLIKFLPDPETGTNTFVVQDPANIRSRFAAFDPARRYESDLLGAADPRLLGAIGLGTAGAVYKTNREKEKDRKRGK